MGCGGAHGLRELSEKDFGTFINKDKLVVVDFSARW